MDAVEAAAVLSASLDQIHYWCRVGYHGWRLEYRTFGFSAKAKRGFSVNAIRRFAERTGKPYDLSRLPEPLKKEWHI